VPETLLPDAPSYALLLLLLSPAVGSFLNVLIDRLPRGESILWPGSTCRSCDTRLGLRDLLPVVSFLLARGRCRHCGAVIPAWHLYVELAAIGLAILALALAGPLAAITLTALTGWLLLALILCDLLWFRLPDGLTAALLLAALAWAGLVQMGQIPPPAHLLLPQTLSEALVGGGIGCVSFWLIRICYQHIRGRQGLGLGDVKLMAALGSLVGPWLLPHLVLAAALMALAAALVTTLRRQRRLSGTSALPFGAALSLAAALIWLLARIPN
jgi:leader peptidase (prepilin peptidase)/N-methyltransferase